MTKLEERIRSGLHETAERIPDTGVKLRETRSKPVRPVWGGVAAVLGVLVLFSPTFLLDGTDPTATPQGPETPSAAAPDPSAPEVEPAPDYLERFPVVVEVEETGDLIGLQRARETTVPTEPTQTNSVGDPEITPNETPNGPLSRKLAQQASAIPELAAFDVPTLKDFSEGGVDAAVVTFQAPDGAFVDVISQQLPEPWTPDLVGSPDVTRTERGPNGEQLIIKQTESFLQVVGVDAEDRMVNIIVNRTTSENPREASSYTDWSLDTVRGWVIQLLEKR